MKQSGFKVAVCFILFLIIVASSFFLWKKKKKRLLEKAPRADLVQPTLLSAGAKSDRQGLSPDTLATGDESPELSHETIFFAGAFRLEQDPATKRRFFEKIIARLTPANALKIRKYMGIADLPRHSWEFREFHQAWGKVGGREALVSAAGTSRQATEATMAGWASADSSSALDFFEDLQANSHNGDGTTNHLSQEYLRLGLIEGLAEADYPSATSLVASQFEAKDFGEKRAGDLIRAVADAVVSKEGLASAAAWATTVPDNLLNEAIAGVAREYAATDVKAGLDWLASLDEQHHQGAAFFHTFDIWAREDPTAAGEYISSMRESYQRNEATVALALRTLSNDSEAAIQWTESLQDPASRNRGFSDTFNSWARLDAIAASEHLADMNPSPERDHAISGFSGSLVVQDPVAAIAWADQIEDSTLRESSLVTVALSFFENNPTAAEAWLPESGLPEKTRQRILNPSADERHLLNFLTQQ